MLLQHADVFADDSGDMGQTELLQHHIETGNVPTIRQPAHRIPTVQQEDIEGKDNNPVLGHHLLFW